MKIKINQDGLQTLLRVVLFFCAIAIIIQLFPKQDTFNKYDSEIGKPWPYGLVTAPFDYPIYKDKDKYEKEQLEIMRLFSPYYRIDKNISEKAINQFLNGVTASDSNARILPYSCKMYLFSQLKFVYSKGIINTDELDSIVQKGQSSINIIDSKKFSHNVSINSVFTVKTAYEFIILKRPIWIDENTLKSANINSYLSENLIYSKELSERETGDLLKHVSQTSGMIQAGERIVDRGEIVTKRTYGLLNSLKIELEKQKSTTNQYNLTWIGESILIGSLMMLLFLYLYLFRQHYYERKRDLFFLLLMILMMISFAVLSIKIPILNIYIVPFALLPIIIRTFFDSRTALFVHTITILQISLIAPDSFEFVLLQLAAGMTVVSSLKDLTQRSQLFRAAILVFASYSIIYVGNCLLIQGDLHEIEWIRFMYFGINALLLLFAYGLIYIFEKIFGFLSNVTLVELSNVNSPLLLQLSEIAPGTFQHSLQVANLVTEAGKKINANTLLLRIGALYHDIGKLTNPMFFTENQLSGINPLAELDYEVAAQHIINHVAEGIKIAQKNDLPERIIDFIRTHHGKSRTRYFYNSFINKFPNVPVNEKAFMYNGPSPKTKEHAILMLADAVEASSRSLTEYSDETINILVDSIINKQIADGLLKDARITFVDVETIREVFKEKLKTIYHTRVSYPELKEIKPVKEADFDY